jgi:sugar lactone lactonase YvrE
MPGGIARDSSGNLYIVDKGNRQILKLQPNGTSSVLNISNMSLSSPTGIAVDRNNNIYVADTGSNHIVKLTLTDATNASVSVLNTGAFTLSQPEAVAVDRQGIVYIANTGSETGGIVRVAPGDTRLIGHFNHPHALAVNPEGDVYVAQNDYTHPVWEIDHEYLQPNSLDFYSSTVTHLAVDGAGNLYVGASAGNAEAIVEFPYDADGVGKPRLAELSSDLGIAGIAADNSGNLYMTSTAGARVFKLTSPAADFGHVQLGSNTPATYDLLFGFASSATVGQLMAYTEGVPNQDYTATASFTCTTIETMQTCSTRGGFLPSGPGVRRGALRFAYSDSENPEGEILSVPLTGVGDAPASGFAAGKVSTVGLGNNLVLPLAMAFDGANNLFVSEMTPEGRKIQKVSAQDGSLSDVNLGGSQSNIMGLAFDTLGYFYFVGASQSQSASAIFGMDLAGNSSPTPIYQAPVPLGSLSNPFGLVGDRAGNLYVADTGNHRVLKATPQIPSSGQPGFTFSQLSTIDINGNIIDITPDTLAVDDSGTVYIADEGDSGAGTAKVVKVTPDGTATVISTGSYQLQHPTAVAVDSAGTLYITDVNTEQLSAVIVKVAATGEVSLVDTGTYSLKLPTGLAFDRNGALYVADVGGPTPENPGALGARILKIDFSSMRALTFAKTNTGLSSTDSPQTVAIFNRGNQPLQFSADPALSNSTDFQQGTTDSACVSGKVLQPGESCGVSLTFYPHSGGNLNTTVTLKNNHLNQTDSTQTITATGTGVAEPTIAGPANQPVQFPIGQQSAVDITVTGESNFPVPTGSLSFTLRSSGGAPLSSGTVDLTAGTASATATLHVPGNLTPGNYTFTVLYSGDVNYLATSTPVDIAVQVNRITPTINWNPPATITAGTDLSGILNATATGAVLIPAAQTTVPGRLAAHSPADSVVAGSFTYTATPTGGAATAVTGATVLGAGSYTLTASFTPNETSYYTSASRSVSLTVGKITPTITLTSSANPVLVMNAVTFTARVASPTGNPTGYVDFYEGTTLLGKDNLTNGTAAFTTSSRAANTYSITATYVGDSNFGSVTSSAVALLVNDFTVTPGSGTGGNGSTAGSADSAPTQIIQAGGTATYTIFVGPTAGITVSEPVTLTVSHDLPPGSTAVLGVVGVDKTGKTLVTTLVIPGGQPMPALELVVHVAEGFSGAGTIGHNRLNPLKTIPFAFGFLLLPFGGRLRQTAAGKRACRTGLLLVLSLLSLAALIGLSGCGAVSSGYLAEHHYTIKVTATSGSLSRTTSFNLVVR